MATTSDACSARGAARSSSRLPKGEGSATDSALTLLSHFVNPNPNQATLPLLDSAPSNGAPNSTVFTDNMALPVHGWFRFSAGFSAQWVESLIREARAAGPVRVLDPFVGSGTTSIAAQRAGAQSIGVEAHPFYGRLAKAKTSWPSIDPTELDARARDMLAASQAVKSEVTPPLLEKCFTDDSLGELLGLRRELEARGQNDPIDELLWLALVAIIRSCSYVGTAQWQYVLPQKRKSRVKEPRQAFRDQVSTMSADIRELLTEIRPAESQVLLEDARMCASVPDEWATLIVTSPPYPNNYDYADAARLEMTLLGEIASWGDLKDKVRPYLVRSCSQHMTGYAIEPALRSDNLAPIRAELEPVVERLSELKASRAGHKAYDRMVVAYFEDLSATWRALRRVAVDGASVCFVVGDSAPYGVHVPVERWLGTLALAAGFKYWEFEKLRDRNVKWRNRKHRVPLQEGRLWVRG